jgi:monoamine oxidase
MQNNSILVIGAGAAGLTAARILAEAGMRVTILEARDRMGGRIHTVRDLPFSPFADLGPEFIHGKLPETFGLMKEAGLKHHRTAGSMWQSKDGRLSKDEHFIENWHVLEEKLEALEENITVDDFLEKHLGGEQYTALRNSVKRYAEGYDTADTSKASMLALKEEWLHEDDSQTQRPDDGYSALIQFLAGKCIEAGGVIRLSSPVKEIRWQQNAVTAITADGREYKAGKVVLTVPVGVWQANDISKGTVQFSPALPEQMAAFGKIGMGAIIKFMMQFKTQFWSEKEMREHTGQKLDDMMFIFSDQQVPTWWTQYPVKSALLTGWLGGPKAAALQHATDDELLELALQSLANIFNVKPEYLKERLGAAHVANWTAIPYTCGSYSYVTTETIAAIHFLKKPVEDTIWFSGEGLYEGNDIGTVEAALASGRQVAEAIIGQSAQ